MNIESLAVMAFCFGFFLFVIFIIARDHREANDRRLMELREFGTGPHNQVPDDPGRHKK